MTFIFLVILGQLFSGELSVISYQILAVTGVAPTALLGAV